MGERIVHEVVVDREIVDDPLIVTEVKCGLAKRGDERGLGPTTFIGMTVTGFAFSAGPDGEEESGDLVLTVELAEAVVEVLGKAIAKAKGLAQANGGDSNASFQGD